ncbi:MAG: hypothetical protein IPG11_18020, partial [Flavobacteriales bacterium]|nr:hypothetical protein [Flavobacteriales bacterium]
ALLGPRNGSDGVLHTIDINIRLASMVDRYVKKAGLQDRIHQHLAAATDA